MKKTAAILFSVLLLTLFGCKRKEETPVIEEITGTMTTVDTTSTIPETTTETTTIEPATPDTASTKAPAPATTTSRRRRTR